MKKVIAGVFCTLVGASAAFAGAPSGAESFPSRPVRIVDGFPAGGSTDALARHIGTGLSQMWGQPVVVENRAGASGQIGADHVARAAADGHTVFIAPNPDILTLGPLLYKNLPYDVKTDFASVAMVAEVPLVMTVGASSPAQNVQQLIELAKAGPGKLTYGSAGPGTVHHLSGAMFTSLAGVDILHVPYKGTAPAVQDLLGGHVDLVFSPITAVLPHIKAGTLKALAVAGARRVSALPDVPTVAEAGVPGYESTLWISLVAPAGAPPAILEKWNAAVARVLSTDETRAMLASQGIEPGKGSVEDIQKRVEADRARWSRVIREAGVSIDQ
ncbi:tripartite tricarboxylate transporter substrate binding protein [Pusillimonas sp.]|uniref:Bug family tripartite tricarboxylate transporter substrate binding protein n=1 Tax=Pusillimonas sp. TaxID=3040095 RepID=UPI0029B3B70D|nr:tripartite tricarboxylate transporter substrate binding protein [Pusillimonas sp.]MDX3896425.1 tripartite tricarboxylate transporter substrate binding protein [Pusillimonas sp.]